MSPKNREGWSFAQFIGMAEHMPDRPQEDLSGQGDFSAPRRERAAVRREFRAIVAGTARQVRKSHAQDGIGTVIRQAAGASMAGTAQTKTTRSGLILPDRAGDTQPETRRTISVTAPPRMTSMEALTEAETRARGSALLL
jgi:hypothetical protein